MNLSELMSEYEELPEYSGIKILHVDQLSLFGDRPINVAATRGSIREMSLLIGAGASLNSPGEHGYTPLHNAVEQGRLDAVVWLIQNGADKNARNTDGQTPAQLAQLLGESHLYEHLISREA